MTADPGLVMTLLGTAEARLDGQRLLLNRRQTEVLALLALHPEGLSLDRLHAFVYGDSAGDLLDPQGRGVPPAGRPRRPARLAALPADDAGRHRRRPRARAAARGRVAEALEAYGGDLLPGTNSPALTELGEYLAVAVREALLADPEPGAVLRYADLAPYDTEVMERVPRRPRHPAAPGQGPAQGQARRRCAADLRARNRSPTARTNR